MVLFWSSPGAVGEDDFWDLLDDPVACDPDPGDTYERLGGRFDGLLKVKYDVLKSMEMRGLSASWSMGMGFVCAAPDLASPGMIDAQMLRLPCGLGES